MTDKAAGAPEQGPPRMDLYLCEGTVVSAREFVSERLDLLAPREAEIVRGALESLPGADAIPKPYRQPMTRSREMASYPTPIFHANRSGARSVFFPDDSLQLKGCRPVRGSQRFPTELLPLGADRITRGSIPFGVMTEEGVLREVLGYCFMRTHGLLAQATPLAVTTYRHGGAVIGYAMLLRLLSEDRVESHLEDTGKSVRQVIEAQSGAAPLPGTIVGAELRLLKVNSWRYLEAKGRMLAAMHWRGGFRGILNSNFGNDVLVPGSAGEKELAFADFDSFFVAPVPAKGGGDSLDPFIIQCLVEVIVGSLPIVQYIDLPATASADKRADALGAVYFTKSSLWRSYYRHFLQEAGSRGWEAADIVDAVERMRKTEAVADVLGNRVLSAESVRQSTHTRLITYTHN